MHSIKFYIFELKSIILGLANLRHLKFSLVNDFLKRIFTGIPSKKVCKITPNIFVGGQIYQRGISELINWGITSTVSLREEPLAKFEKSNFKTLHVPTYDNQAPSIKEINYAIKFINQQIASGGKIYIHCYFGVGRGPTMTAAYLISRGMTVDQAIEKIKKVRPFIRITRPQYQRLQKYQKTIAHQ